MGVLHSLLVSVFSYGVINWRLAILIVYQIWFIHTNMTFRDFHEEAYYHIIHTKCAMYSMIPCPPQNLSKDLPASEAFARPLGISR